MAKAVLAKELRWFVSVQGLLSRSDRDDAILERAEQLRQRVSSVQTVMEALSETDPPPSKEVWSACKRDFAQMVEIHDNVIQTACGIKRRRMGEIVPSTPPPTGAPAITGRLPTLQLSNFGGAVEEWVAYKNMFYSLVDTRPDLTRGQKMAYLLSTLQGEARALVQHLRVDDDHYETAWEVLMNRYHNVRLLANAHARQLLSLPRVVNRVDLRMQLLTPVTVAYNALRTLGLPVEEWSFLLVHILLTKLPTDVRSRFEREVAEKEGTALPGLGDLMKFLEYEARVVETSRPDLSPSGAQACRYGPSQGRRSASPTAQTQRRRTTARLAALTAAADRDPACLQCGQSGHPLVMCQEWQRLPVTDRRRMTKRRSLCFGCLGDHFERDCPRPQRCSACDGPHHLLLCANSSGAADRDPACLQCGQSGHPLVMCQEWQRLPVTDRRRMTKRRSLCFGCLGDHFERDCPRPQRCSACDGPHHLLLCANSSGAADRDPVCLQCGQSGHALVMCQEWQELPVTDRRRMAKRRSLCFGCLGDHFERNCPTPQRCSACDGPHHSLLCANSSGAASPTAQQRRTMGGGAPEWSPSPTDWRPSPTGGAPTYREVSHAPAREPIWSIAPAGLY